MNPEARNEFDASYNARVGKIRAAAAIALKELDQLRLGGHITGETLDTRSRALHRRSCTLTDAISLFIGWDDGLTQFMIKVQIATK